MGQASLCFRRGIRIWSSKRHRTQTRIACREEPKTMIDETKQDERIGFCQDCGKPLTKESVRTVGSGVFCEPCLEVRVGTASAAGSAGTAGAVPPGAAGQGAYP